MVHIKAFEAIHPPYNRVASVASPPYDVMNTSEARQLAEGHPDSFLHVIRPEINLPDGTDPYGNEVYDMARSQFQRLVTEGALCRDGSPGIFLYRQVMNGHSQTGLVCCCRVSDYVNDVIRKHEKTRPDKEDDRTRHLRTVDANTGPVFLTYRDEAAIQHLSTMDSAGRPLFHFKSPDGVTHTGWQVADPAAYITAFESIPFAYVADGHHRSASAARAAREIADGQSRTELDGSHESDWFLSVLFPASQLAILPYNRVVKTKGKLSGDDALKILSELGQLELDADPDTQIPGSFAIYLNKQWVRLHLEQDSISWQDPIASLDVSLLHDRILEPLLGIKDERTDPNIEFVGGIRGTSALSKRVDELEDAIGFSLNATTIEQLLDVADAGLCMPPKSTWFEPKLRSGLFIHALDSEQISPNSKSEVSAQS